MNYEDACATADRIIAAYKVHYDFPWQGESHMHDCIVGELTGPVDAAQDVASSPQPQRRPPWPTPSK
jgi:hypothetical protein